MYSMPHNKGGGSAAQTVRTYGCYTSSFEIIIMHHLAKISLIATKIHKTRVDPVASYLSLVENLADSH